MRSRRIFHIPGINPAIVIHPKNDVSNVTARIPSRNTLRIISQYLNVVNRIVVTGAGVRNFDTCGCDAPIDIGFTRWPWCIVVQYLTTPNFNPEAAKAGGFVGVPFCDKCRVV